MQPVGLGVTQYDVMHGITVVRDTSIKGVMSCDFLTCCL